MSKPNYIKEWRRFRGMTQTELADQIGMAMSHLSRIEVGRVAYTQQVLEKIAAALGCGPADLIARNPEGGADIMELWASLSSEAQDQIRSLAKMLGGKS